MTPNEQAALRGLRDWARQTIYFALNQRTNGGPEELMEQMAIRAGALADRFMGEATAEAGGDPGRIILLVPRKVFDWVEGFRR